MIYDLVKRDPESGRTIPTNTKLTLSEIGKYSLLDQDMYYGIDSNNTFYVFCKTRKLCWPYDDVQIAFGTIGYYDNYRDDFIKYDRIINAYKRQKLIISWKIDYIKKMHKL